jgi:DNA invertase Pin-like site-specific DNA recombinase
MTAAKTVGYVRVRGLSPDQLVEERMVRLQSQRVMRECGRLGWLLDELFIDRAERAGDPGHPGLVAAVELVRQGGYAALIVAFFDRLARLEAEFVALSAVAQAEGWRLIIAR